MTDEKPYYRHNSTIRVTSGEPLTRGRAPKRRTRPRARRVPKRFSKLRDPVYREWIRTLRCVIERQHECIGEVQCCHVRPKGPGNPDRRNCYPGCAAAHDEQHRRGIKTFQAKYSLDLTALAIELDNWYATEEPAF